MIGQPIGKLIFLWRSRAIPRIYFSVWRTMRPDEIYYFHQELWKMVIKADRESDMYTQPDSVPEFSYCLSEIYMHKNENAVPGELLFPPFGWSCVFFDGTRWARCLYTSTIKMGMFIYTERIFLYFEDWTMWKIYFSFLAGDSHQIFALSSFPFLLFNAAPTRMQNYLHV